MSLSPDISPLPPSPAFPIRSMLLVLATLVGSVAVYALLPYEMGELARRAVAIAFFAAVLWATEGLPLFVTSLCVIALQILFLANKGGLAGTGDLSHTQFFEPFASSTIILFMGGFLLARAITKHHLDNAIASRFLKPFMRTSLGLIMAVIFTTGFLSIWISNTAAAVMMIAIITGLINDKNAPPKLITALVLAVAFGASIGGISTPVSSPPNAITIAQLKASGIQVDFVQWVIMAVPLAAFMLTLTGFLLYFIIRPPKTISLSPIIPPSRITWHGWATLIVLACAVIAWFTGPWHKVDDAVVALIAAAILTALGVLDTSDIHAIDWDILLLMWGGLALGNALNLTHALDYAAQLPIFQQSGWVMALVLTLTGLLLATFMSNTAAANVLVPLAIVLSDGDSGRLAIIAGLTITFGIALPVSTPPNAIAFATGKVSAPQMFLIGSIISVISIIMMMLGYLWVVPWVLNLK